MKQKKSQGLDSEQDPKIQELETRVADLEARLARALADYTNLENRFGRESSAVVKFATAGLLQKLLTVRDHLEMAATAFPDKSLAMILSQFDSILVDEGVKEISVQGLFDPALMECQDQVVGKKDEVVGVIQKGYRLQDRVLRPARVVVGNGMTGDSEPAERVGNGTDANSEHVAKPDESQENSQSN